MEDGKYPKIHIIWKGDNITEKKKEKIKLRSLLIGQQRMHTTGVINAIGKAFYLGNIDYTYLYTHPHMITLYLSLSGTHEKTYNFGITQTSFHV